MIKTKNIKQGLMIKAAPHEVFEALMDAKKHSQFTGDLAKISRAVGGEFTTFSGYATGKNLEIIKDEKIVQTWRASDWPEGHYSTITYVLKPAVGGTKLMFSQKGIPESEVAAVSDGWKTYYWQPLKDFLEKGKN